MQIFVEVARERSFRGAADNLEIPNSTVSRRIAELERDVGLRLFDRSTRQVNLTEAGRHYFTSCERILQDAQLATAQLADLRSSPSGELHIVANNVPAHLWIIPLLPAFTRNYPDIKINLDIISDVPSPLKEGVDVAFMLGPIEHGDFVARSVLKLSELKLYASPDYLRQNGKPTTPSELGEQECLRHLRLPEWHLLHRGSGNKEVVFPRGRISVADFGALQRLSLKHKGICMWHEYHARPLVKDGQLERVLPDWSFEPWEIFTVTTSRHVPAKVRAFNDFIIDNIPR